MAGSSPVVGLSVRFGSPGCAGSDGGAGGGGGGGGGSEGVREVSLRLSDANCLSRVSPALEEAQNFMYRSTMRL